MSDRIEQMAREIRRADEIDRVMSNTPPEEQQFVWDQYLATEATMQLPSERVCAACGCSNLNACITPSGPCFWVAADLCSGCVLP
ncbi:hypothetical protein LCGC14_0594960 [marine sediment metagenome]|uniref:Uncharacterized protein n=1 Tax=marine sediment metagenome TaxID=412755 RepID=A0A0F9RVX8_9ZZZZ